MANGQHSFVSQYYEHDVQSYGEVQSNSASNVPYGISPNMTSYTFCTLDPSLDSASHRQTSSSPIGSESSKSSASSLSSSSLGTVEKGQAGKQGKRKGVPYIPSYMDPSNGPQPCVVCGDSATGYHYRCITCEGCKGFFRRTIQKQLQYHCKWNGQCDIDKATRNQCQQCRYKKCIFVGMAKDLVLSERQRKAKRKLIEENREKRKVESIKLKQKTSNCEHEMLSVYEQTLIKQVNSAYESTVTKVRNRVTVPDGINTEFQSADPEVWQQIADAMTPSIIKVVEFAKGVPGFIQLNVDDQILLLKSCCMEIMCLRASCRYDPDTETLTLYNGMQLHKSQMSQGKLGVLVEPIFEFAVGLSKLKLDKTEVALLAAVLLMQSDRSDLKDADAVERIQDSILGAYKNYVTWKRPDQPVHWAKILMKVTDLRTISTRHAERVLCIRLDNSGEIPPLLFEVFNEGHVQL